MQLVHTDARMERQATVKVMLGDVCVGVETREAVVVVRVAVTVAAAAAVLMGRCIFRCAHACVHVCVCVCASFNTPHLCRGGLCRRHQRCWLRSQVYLHKHRHK